jgi:glycosyltransferase involved in cell wall biosynthesis
LRVALVNLTSGGMSGGYQKYLEIMLPLLVDHPDISSLELASPSGLNYRRDARVPEWCWPDSDPRAGFPLLRSHLTARSPDVVFVPTARMVPTGMPTVVMVRNMEPLVAPFAGNSVRDGIRNLARRFVARSSVRRAARVIAVSPFVRDFVTTTWHIPSDKVGVVPHGVDLRLPSGEHVVPSVAGITGPGVMLFTAGSIRPARGLEDAIYAVEDLRARGITARLVIAGKIAGDTQRYRRSLDETIARRGLSTQVIWAGSLTAAEMAWCFSNCTAFIMTSRVEACPNTALEALSYGAVSVSTSNRPMPETFATGATYYAAGNHAELAARVIDVLGLSSGERAAASLRATQRAHDFDWATTARDTVRQLAIAAGRG